MKNNGTQPEARRAAMGDGLDGVEMKEKLAAGRSPSTALVDGAECGDTELGRLDISKCDNDCAVYIRRDERGGYGLYCTPRPALPATFDAKRPGGIEKAKGSPADSSRPGLAGVLTAEALGTMFIVIFGVGSVCTAVTTGAQEGLWQVAVVWGFGVTIAILCTAQASGAHLNPAVSLAFHLCRPESAFTIGRGWRSLLLYWIAQVVGAVLGGCVNLGIYGETLKQYEKDNNITRGDPGSVASAMTFGEYFPNPGFKTKVPDIGSGTAMLVEAWGTFLLCFVIFSLTHERFMPSRSPTPRVWFIAGWIGFTVAVLISLYAPLTQAGWNPARDFGPRVVATCAGWGSVAIPGPKSGFWVYIVGPLLGGPLGAFAAETVMNRLYLTSSRDHRD